MKVNCPNADAGIGCFFMSLGIVALWWAWSGFPGLAK